MRQGNKLNFSGQVIFIGLDIHKVSWMVSIIIGGFEHKTFSQPPDPAMLARYLHRHFPGARFRCVYEAGYFGFWIHDALEALGIECMVIHPADVPATDKERRRKNDRIDSRKLARALCDGRLEAIYVPVAEVRAHRSLLRFRAVVVNQQKQCKSRIKALLSYHGIAIPGSFDNRSWSHRFFDWLEQVEIENAPGRATLRFYVEELRHFKRRLSELNSRIAALAKEPAYQDRVKHLMSVPGIGLITAMILLTELVDIGRFRTLDHLASYIGLVPGERSSGEGQHQTGMIGRGHGYLRAILMESAWVAVRKDPALMMAFQKLCSRMKKQRAIVQIARKLLNRVRFVMKHNEPYVMAVVG